MRTISFIYQVDAIENILQHLGLKEESYASPENEPHRKEIKELTVDSSYSQLI